MSFQKSTYRPKRLTYCQYCGARQVVWKKEKKPNGSMGYALYNMLTGEPHYQTCTSQREHAKIDENGKLVNS